MSLVRKWVVRHGGQLTRRRLRETVKPLRRNAPRSLRWTTQPGSASNSAQHQVDQARAGTQAARDQLSKTHIVAPMAGRITRLAVEEGHARAEAAAHDADQADPAPQVQDVAIAQSLGAEALQDVGGQADPGGPDAAPVRPRRELQKTHRRHLLDGDRPDRVEREGA